MSKGLNNKIILSLAYTDQFKYPLTKEEIFLRIIGKDTFVSPEKIEKTLKKMVLDKEISSGNEFYFLNGSEKNIKSRLKRKTYSKKKWQEVQEFVKLMKFIPWINGVAVTGSLSVDNAKKNDDIDFLIVTKKNRLWLSRVFVVLLLFLKGKKRSWNGDEDNSWCLNFWLDDTSLKLPKRLHNIYGAFEVCQAIWVYDREDIKKSFFELNNWAEPYLPNYFSFQKNNKSYLQKPIFVRDIPLLDVANRILFFIQYLYMKRHMTKERVDENFAFFHPRDTKKQIFKNWLRKYRINHVVRESGAQKTEI